MVEDGGAEKEFLADAALGRLARYMRMLGYDVAYVRGRDGAAVLRETLRTGRTLLTRRRDLAAREDISAFLVEDDDVLAQLAAAARRFELRFTADAMTRCIECNEPLRGVPKEEVWDLLPPHVRKTQEKFTRCPSCGRVYWPGTHYARAVARLLEALRES
ncbi:MAG TPA: Mut7-C RNAse domain-containing protein [bacterium]|nr:Mut7-C RNAse domain-containing protein [bacterium]